MYTKKFYWAILSLLLSFLALSFATSCTEDIEKKDNGPILVESILLNAESVTLNISEKYKLSATITPENATDKTLQWRSENPAIASVSDEGEIVAVAGGSTTINAIANGGAFAACSVIVNAPEPDPEPEPEPEKPLKGAIIGTEMSVDYSQSGFPASTTANTKAMAFDGNFDTFFASYDRSGTWVGMDLQTKYVITKIGYAPRRAHSSRVQLAVIEGANKSDFSDAMPIHIIKESAPEGKMTYAEVECSRGFRYVRYVTPNDVRCNIAELEFYGTKGEMSVNGRIVGLSDRINTILVPIDFLQKTNNILNYNATASTSRIVIEVNNPSDVKISQYLADNNYEVENDATDSAKTKHFLRLLLLVVVLIGLTICALSIYVLMLSIFLLLQKMTYCVDNLLLIGYSTREISKPYCLIGISLNLLSLLLALISVCILRNYYLPHLETLYPFDSSSMQTTIISGLSICIFISIIYIIAISRKVTAIWNIHKK